MRFISVVYTAIFHPQPIIVLLVSLSVLIGTTVGLSKNGRRPSDPFAPYVDVLPGRMAENVKAPEFTCNNVYTAPQQNFSTCGYNPKSGPFLLITVTFSGINVIEHTAFTLPQNALQAGDLVSLWGRPQKIELIGPTMYLFWPERCVMAWVKADSRHYSHWLPVWYVVFDCK